LRHFLNTVSQQPGDLEKPSTSKIFCS